MDQNQRRDKDRLIMALSFLGFMVLWFVFIGVLLLMGICIDSMGFFGLGTVTGSLGTILALIYQFFFRTSGDTNETEDKK